MLFNKVLVCSFILTIVLLPSCAEQDEGSNIQTDKGEQAIEAESVLIDAINTAQDGVDQNVDGISGGRMNTCATFTSDRDEKTITIDFGSGCPGLGNRTRKGMITVKYEGISPESPTTRTLTFANYGIDDKTISGTVTQTSIERNGSLYSFSVSASQLTVTLGSGAVHYIDDLMRTFTYNIGLAGQPADDVLVIEGYSTHSQDEIYVEITAPITVNGSCILEGIIYPSSGTYRIIDNRRTYLIDWGNNTCDSVITITAFGQTLTKTLP